MKNLGLVVSVLMAACATETAAPSVPLIDGFHPDAPGPDGIQFVIPAIRAIPPGADQTMCTYLDYRSDRELDIYDYTGFQSSAGSHHTILYAVDNTAPSDTHICNEDDMINARYLAGGGADSPGVKLPDGIVIRLPKQTQIMIQTHWINATDLPIDGQAAFNINVEDPKPTNVNAQLFVNTTTMMQLAPGAGAARATCTAGQDMNFFMIGGHAHEWGTHVSLTLTPSGGTSKMIYDTPWGAEFQFNPPRNEYTKDAPFTIHAGDKLTVDCTYNNDTGSMIQFPREMCVAFGYFFPATQEIDCVDGNWPR